MFKKRIRCAKFVLIGILSLSVVFAVFLGVTLHRNKGSETMKVLMGDASYVDGIEISLFEEDEAMSYWFMNHSEGLCQCETDYQNSYRIQFDGTEAIMNVSCETADREFKTYSHCYNLNPRNENRFRYKEGCGEVAGSDISGVLFAYTYEQNSLLFEGRYRADDYISFGEEDKFLYYYNEDTRRSYEAFSLTMKDESEIERNVCYLNGKEYLYFWKEPEYEYYCTYNRYAGADESSASMETQKWGFEEACENIPDKSYVSKLKEFGMPEITMNVKTGIYCVEADGILKGTLTCVLPMSDMSEDFEFLWMATVEEENALSVIGRKGNNLVEFRYFAETGTVTEQVLWEEGAETAEWFEEAEDVLNVDIMTDGGRTYLCYSKAFYEPAGEAYSYVKGDIIRLVVFEQGNRVFEGEIRLQKELFEVLQDFSLNTNEVHDRDQRMCGIEIRKK